MAIAKGGRPCLLATLEHDYLPATKWENPLVNSLFAAGVKGVDCIGGVHWKNVDGRIFDFIEQHPRGFTIIVGNKALFPYNDWIDEFEAKIRGKNWWKVWTWFEFGIQTQEFK